MFGDGQDIDAVKLEVGDRVAAMDEAGKMRKGRVAMADESLGIVGVTFKQGDIANVRQRSEVLPLYRYTLTAHGEMVSVFVNLPAAK